MQIDYYYALEKIFNHLNAKNYVEIGVRNGQSMSLNKPRTFCLGIDPKPNITFEINKASKIFPMTSDEFFEKFDIIKELNGDKIQSAFIDGMHLFEFALRDFINIERNSCNNSIIILHDIEPPSEIAASRIRKSDVWVGDVYKMVYCLKKYRPDLKIVNYHIPPSGLTIITNLNPDSDILHRNYQLILAEYANLAYTGHSDMIDFSQKHFESNFLPLCKSTIQSNESELKEIPILFSTYNSRQRKKPRALGVLLCYNDADILEEQIEYLLSQNHDIIVWDHGSDDATSDILNKSSNLLVENKFIPRSFDFYKLYPAMSQNLIDNYLDKYDFISWPDQDEILEGPFRDRDYYEYITEVYNSPYSWIQFNNFTYWYSKKDDKSKKPIERMNHYSIFNKCAPRIRAWKAESTNIRIFNHNPPIGEKFPLNFNLRHYPFRNEKQLIKRLLKDRAGIECGGLNYHYENMKKKFNEILSIRPEMFYIDDSRELNHKEKFDWDIVYGKTETASKSAMRKLRFKSFFLGFKPKQ